MPATTTDYNNIKLNQEKAASLNTQAAGYTAGSNVLGDRVMEAVRADRTSRGVSKLATDVGNVSGQMVTDPNAIRATQSEGLIDPFSVNQLTSNARAQNLRTLGTISTQESLNQGGIDEVIQAGANQLKARAATLLAEAEKANAEATALQGEWERMMAEKEFELKQSTSGGTGTGFPTGLETPNTLETPATGTEEYPVYPGSQETFNAGNVIKELTPEYIKDPIGYATAKIRENMLKVGLDFAFKQFKKKSEKEKGSW